VTAAYLVVFVAIALYVALIALKLARLQREVGELSERAREQEKHG
jgi:CcmD family protein